MNMKRELTEEEKAQRARMDERLKNKKSCNVEAEFMPCLDEDFTDNGEMAE